MPAETKILRKGKFTEIQTTFAGQPLALSLTPAGKGWLWVGLDTGAISLHFCLDEAAVAALAGYIQALWLEGPDGGEYSDLFTEGVDALSRTFPK